MLILISNDDFTNNDYCEFWRKCWLMVKGLDIYIKHTHIHEKIMIFNKDDFDDHDDLALTNIHMSMK